MRFDRGPIRSRAFIRSASPTPAPAATPTRNTWRATRSRPISSRSTRRSVHWAAMTAKGDLSAPTCNSCHGNHGAVPPGVNWVGNVCGQCHTVQADLFKSSVHAKAFTEMGTPGCATCHENHAIRRARRLHAGARRQGRLRDAATVPTTRGARVPSRCTRGSIRSGPSWRRPTPSCSGPSGRAWRSARPSSI